jgi:hypothetical protein
MDARIVHPKEGNNTWHGRRRSGRRRHDRAHVSDILRPPNACSRPRFVPKQAAYLGWQTAEKVLACCAKRSSGNGICADMRDFTLRVLRPGNPGNIMMMYLTAHRMQKILGFGTIANVNIPIFGIAIPDKNTHGTFGLHDRESTNAKFLGAFQFTGYKSAVENSDSAFLCFEAYYQNIENFYDRANFDYDILFPPILDQNEFGREDQLVISIRGGEILTALHRNYTLLPINFYQHVIAQTGLEPVFFGQLTDSPYLADLRQAFPKAKFIAGKNPAFDFDFLRRSKNIVISVSTFSWMASWLSNAERIFLPITGMLNPKQQQSTMLLPHNDPRYTFFQFPLNYALPVERYREYLDPIQDLWHPISSGGIMTKPPTIEKSLDNYMACFDPQEYLQIYPHGKAAYDQYGYPGLMNDFTETGFWHGRNPCLVDERFYTRTYPLAAMEIAKGLYVDVMHHYSEVGRHLGYKIKQP